MIAMNNAIFMQVNRFSLIKLLSIWACCNTYGNYEDFGRFSNNLVTKKIPKLSSIQFNLRCFTGWCRERLVRGNNRQVLRRTVEVGDLGPLPSGYFFKDFRGI